MTSHYQLHSTDWLPWSFSSRLLLPWRSCLRLTLNWHSVSEMRPCCCLCNCVIVLCTSLTSGHISSDWHGETWEHCLYWWTVQRSVTWCAMTNKNCCSQQIMNSWRKRVKKGEKERKKKKLWLALDSLGLFLSWGGGKRQMSDKFRRLRGVLIVPPAPHCVMSCSLTGGVRRGDETETSIPLWFPCVCRRRY